MNVIDDFIDPLSSQWELDLPEYITTEIKLKRKTIYEHLNEHLFDNLISFTLAQLSAYFADFKQSHGFKLLCE